MVKINIEGTDYNLPEKWSEIIIKDFYKFRDLEKLEKENDDILLDIINILTGIDKEILENIPYIDLLRIGEKLDFLTRNVNEDELVFEFFINDRKFVMLKDLSKLTSRQYIDLDILIKNTDENLVKIMAILYREEIDGKIKKYDSNNLEEEEKFFYENIPISYAFSAMVFFLIFVGCYYQTTQDYSQEL